MQWGFHGEVAAEDGGGGNFKFQGPTLIRITEEGGTVAGLVGNAHGRASNCQKNWHACGKTMSEKGRLAL